MPRGSTSMQQDLSPLLPKPWAFTPQPSSFGWVDGLASLSFFLGKHPTPGTDRSPAAEGSWRRRLRHRNTGGVGRKEALQSLILLVNFTLR